MYLSLFTAMVGTVVALVLVYRDRRNQIERAIWWGLPVAVTLVPALIWTTIDYGGGNFALTRYALWGTAFVGTLCMLFVTYGRAGDGRAVRWIAPSFALLGIMAVGVLHAKLGALIAPLTVFAVVARALPRAPSVIVRRRTVAALGIGATTAAAGAYALTTATPVFGVAVVVMSLVIGVSLSFDSG